MGSIYFDDWKPKTAEHGHTDKNDLYEVTFARRVEVVKDPKTGEIETMLIKTDPPLLADHETFMKIVGLGVDVKSIDWKQWVGASKADKTAARAAGEPEPKGKFQKSAAPAQILAAQGKQ